MQFVQKFKIVFQVSITIQKKLLSDVISIVQSALLYALEMHFFIYHFKDILYIDFTISSGSVDVTQSSYCLISIFKNLSDTVFESLLFTKIENVFGILTCQKCWWRFIRTRNWRRIREIRYEYLQLFDTSLIQNVDFLTFSNHFNDLEFVARSCYVWRFQLNWFCNDTLLRIIITTWNRQ